LRAIQDAIVKLPASSLIFPVRQASLKFAALKIARLYPPALFDLKNRSLTFSTKIKFPCLTRNIFIYLLNVNFYLAGFLCCQQINQHCADALPEK